jgi:two-component system LytT family response regulator
MLIKTIIIEDERKSVYLLNELVNLLAPDLDVCGTASHIDSAVELIATTAPDLVFLDVCIADGSGFDVLRKLPSRNFELICVTAYNSYALEAIRFSAIDYLLKPVGIEEFTEAMNRLRKRLSEKKQYNKIGTLLHNLAQLNEQDKRISIATINGYAFIYLRDISWCESNGSYTIFHLTDSSIVSSTRNMGLYEELLCGSNFYRIHNSTIINMHLIKKYTKGKGCFVVMTDGTELEVSQRRRSDFLDKIDSYCRH